MGDFNSRYMRNDGSDFLLDQNEIENFKQQQIQDVIDNNMLGDFNSDGHYVVDKSIIHELIMTTKVITGAYGDFKFCQSTKKFEGIGNIQFAVDFSSNPENGQAVAVLVLLESMKACNGFIDNTNGVSIAKFVGNNDKNFVERALKYFYVFLPDEIDGASYIENDKDIHFSNILSRLSYLRSIKKISDPYINKIERDTFRKKSKTLNENTKGKSIFEDFDEERVSISDKFLDSSKNDYYKMLNSLLDKTLAKYEKNVKSEKELDTSLKKIENLKRNNSKKVIDYSEKETVDNKLSLNADTVSKKKSNSQKSKGLSPVAIYREPKKSYEDIEKAENAQYVVRDNAKSSAKATGPKLFGKNKQKYKEPVIKEVSETDKEVNKQDVPKKLSPKPSYLKNDRYEEIKNSEIKGEKLSTNPSPYSRGNKTQNVAKNEAINKFTNEDKAIKSNTAVQQNANGEVDKEALLRQMLNKDQESKNPTNVQQDRTQQVQKEQGLEQKTQQIQNKNQQIQNQTQQTQYQSQTQQPQNIEQGYQNQYQGQYNNYPNGPYGPRGPHNLYGPNNPYGPYGRGVDSRYGLESVSNGPEFGPKGPFDPRFLGMAGVAMGVGMGMMGKGPSPFESNMTQGQEMGQNPPTFEDPGLVTLKPMPVPPVEVDGPNLVVTPGLEYDGPHHIDAHPIVNHEEIIKQIFGNDVYELTRENEEKERLLAQQRQQQQQQNVDEESDENAMVFIHIKH